MFLSNGLKLPDAWRSHAPVPMSAENSESPLYGIIEAMKPHAEMHEGTEAFDRFRHAVQQILTVPKTALPPSPFGKPKKKKKPANPKA